MSTIFMNYKGRLALGSSGGNHAIADFDTDTIQAALIDTGTVDPDYTTHEDWADLVTALVGTATTMSGISNIGSPPNVDLDAADTTISSVSGSSAEELVVFMNSGTNSTSPLIVQWDSGDVTNLPVTPNGGDITIQWNASGFLRW